MPTTNPFTTRYDFREPFLTDLKTMISMRRPDLGQMLLAFSNFGFNGNDYPEDERQAIAANLSLWLDEIAQDVRQKLMAGSEIPARDDDTLVFLKIREVGIEAALVTDEGAVGEWPKVFIPVRSFRPRRVTVEKFRTLKVPFDATKFNYGWVRDQEGLWVDTISGIHAFLLYNKFPFAPYHTVVVPHMGKELPQYLEGEYHEWLWDLLGPHDIIPGLYVGYNSLGAFASVNHLHFQLIVDADGIPAADQRWEHNGGNEEYPTKCERFDDCQRAWAYIEKLHQIPTPYNLIYTPGNVHCFPRFWQDIPPHAKWTTGFAFYEMGGKMLTVNRDAFRDLDEPAVVTEFDKMWI